jgi:hypothetical protein
MFARDVVRQVPQVSWSVPPMSRSRLPGPTAESARSGGPAFDFANVSVASAQPRTASISTSGCSGSKTKCSKCNSANPGGSASGNEIQTQAGGDVATPEAEEASGGTPAPARPRAHARLRSGPRYTPNGNLTPTVSGGRKRVDFDFDGVFDSDPAAGVFPSCGEIHQDIKWNAAAATSFTAISGNPVPHSGFPAAHSPMVWIEDRDGTDTLRYGRRSGPHLAPSAGNEYTNAGVRNMARGATYHGHDGPNGPSTMVGRWHFMVLAFDMCNHGVQVGSADFITIDW